MPDSIKEKILKNVVTTLQGITILNGYDFDVRQVLRVPTSAFELTIFPVVMISDVEEETDEDSPVTKTNCLLHLEILFMNYEFHDASEEATAALANIEKALKVDITRGGNAYQTRFVGNSLIVPNDTLPYGGILIRVDIHYRYTIGNPFII